MQATEPQPRQWEKLDTYWPCNWESEGPSRSGCDGPRADRSWPVRSGPLPSLSASPQPAPQVGALQAGAPGGQTSLWLHCQDQKEVLVPSTSCSSQAVLIGQGWVTCPRRSQLQAPTLLLEAWLSEQQLWNPWGLLGSGASGPCLSSRVRVCAERFQLLRPFFKKMFLY